MKIAMNELLNKDTTTMSTEELEKHVSTTIMELFSIMKTKSQEFHELFKRGQWYSDNQSPGIRAATIALYQQHVSKGVLTIKHNIATQQFTISPERKNPINYHCRGGSSRIHAFDSYDMVKYTNYINNPKDIVFETTNEELPPLTTDKIGKKFLDAYTMMQLVCNGGKYDNNTHKPFSETIMKTDTSMVYGSSIYSPEYGGNPRVFGVDESFSTYTIAHSKPFMKFHSIREYIITDMMKNTVFVNLIVPISKPEFIHITGNKEMLREYWAQFLERNRHRVNDEFMNETYEISKRALLETLNAQQLEKVI